MATIPAIAATQIQQTWGLLLAIAAAVLVAVTLAAAVVPFSQVMQIAALRDALTASADGDRFVTTTTPTDISSAIAQRTTSAIDRILAGHLGAYLSGAREVFVDVPNLVLLAPSPIDTGSGPTARNNTVTLVGADEGQAAAATTLIAGRLPRDGGPDVEVAITPGTATQLGLTVGGVLSALTVYTVSPATSALPPQLATHLLRLPVVGIFTPSSGGDPVVNAATFSPQPAENGYAFPVLVSRTALLATLDRLATPASPSSASPVGATLHLGTQVVQIYHLDIARLAIDQLDDLVGRVNALQVDFSATAQLSGVFSSTIAGGPLGADGTLQTFGDQSHFPLLVVTLFALQITALVLLFIGALVEMLAERQRDSIALLRSRGAARRHIFAALALPGLGIGLVGLVALVAGLLLAIPVALLLARGALPAGDAGALDVVAVRPWQTAADLWPYGLAMAGAAVATMLLVVGRATRSDVLAARREAGRSSQRPAWQRLRLDVVAALLAATVFGVSSYVTGTGLADARSQSLLAPVSLAAPVCLAIAVALLAARLFPWLVGGVARLAAGGRRAPGQLALAQIARTPGRSLRTILLLAFALALVVVTVVFAASQEQRLPDVATYQAVADFSGQIAPDVPPQSLDALASDYGRLAGIRSVSVGYLASTFQAALSAVDELQAVDTRTFARTANWTHFDSAQPLASLLARIPPGALAAEGVPALVDAPLWQALGLHAGEAFELQIAAAAAGPGASHRAFPFVAVAEIQHLPPITEGPGLIAFNDVVSAGLLVDYQAYATLYHSLEDVDLSPNYVWMRTAGDTAALAAIRRALTQGPVHLDPLYDRRALLDHLRRDALYRDLVDVPQVGALCALLLTLVGVGMATWQEARTRLAGFALLRALGTSRGQVARMLLWEQGITCATAIALGLGLAGGVARALVFTGSTAVSVAGVVSGQTSTDEFFLRQHAPPVQVVYPAALVPLVLGLAALCAVAAMMMAWRVSRPPSGETLRFDDA